MGMDLVGFLISAPIKREITDEMIESHRQRALELVEPVYRYLTDETLPNNKTSADMQAAVKEVEALYADSFQERFEDIGDELEDSTEILGQLRSPQAFRSQVRALEERLASALAGSRDLAMRELRIDGELRHILFAGEGTWGDEPEGVAYSVIKDIHEFGVAELFDLR